MLGAGCYARFSDYAWRPFDYRLTDINTNIYDPSITRRAAVAITRFEDLLAWQEARTLHKMTREMTASSSFNDDWSLRNQLRRSSNSAMANIAEGFNRFGTGEFCQFLSIAKGSCGETQSHLYAALDAKFITSDVFSQLYDQTQSVMNLVARLRSAVRSTNRTSPHRRQSRPSAS